MKKWIKILVIILSIPVVLFVVLLGAYIIMNWQGVIDPYQVGDPNAQQKILIASQGSDFKYKLLDDLVPQLKGDNVYLSIIDCTTLKKDNSTDWNAIVIIHTTKAHQMPKYVSTYLKRFSDLSRFVLVSTSGGGDEMVTEFEVDAICTASWLSDAKKISDRVASKVENILASNSP
jgi:hypothetical protein